MDQHHDCELVAQAAANAIAEMFNGTSGHHRPILLAAIRMAVEGAVATLNPTGRAAYEDALENMEVHVIKRPRRGST